MNKYLCIQDEHRSECSEAWVHKAIADRTDMSQDPRDIFRLLTYWAKEHSGDARMYLRDIRALAVSGKLTPEILEEKLHGFSYFRNISHVYLAAREHYRE